MFRFYDVFGSGVDVTTARTQVEALRGLWLRVLAQCSRSGVALAPARTWIEALGGLVDPSGTLGPLGGTLGSVGGRWKVL